MMSNYKFAPPPPKTTEHEPFVVWTDGFSEEELDRIEAYCDNNLQKRKATVSQITEEMDISDIRSSDVSWISMDEDTAWFYDKIAYIARSLNGQFYNFDLYGFNEDFQYTVYDADKEGHYTWHVDATTTSMVPRKLSLVLQLTDPSEYEGGELEILNSKDAIPVEKKRGLVAAFPSYTLHRVSPITKGIRKTIVIWSCGPAFK